MDVNKANASIRSTNTGPSSTEKALGKVARGASAGINRLAVSIVKGATVGDLPAHPPWGSRGRGMALPHLRANMVRRE